MDNRILLTGASGFVGGALFKNIELSSNVEVSVAVRSKSSEFKHLNCWIVDFASFSDISEVLKRQDVVVHTAAVAHNKKIRISSDFEHINTRATLRLAQQAAECGVKRFIFVSSIGVNGNISSKPFTELDIPKPSETYAESKWRAEQGLWEIQESTGMEIVIIRPPLVYGPNAPGNFATLTRWVEKGIPLPLGAVNNRRSYIAIDNLVDFITTCIDHPLAANETFLIADGEDISTTHLLHKVANAMDKPSRLIPVPERLLTLGATMLGKRDMARRLLGSLQVDISKARQLLGWQPTISLEEGLKRCFK
ncbi:nucleoside-diphosphate-sugar epimerase [Idiomarina fontislapidosi]|uniref:Nucleoside-diphosphate sugar epimerase n=1 Tax=Idiomarina fontislapidosi TaxID=263723 RepID=A0A432XJ55_9GAMM|nr:NAD-dependent epimerase/dehydratase family protein [Idiomarina fontislapidosi]PYE30187.1 nucleoside-diphosphate-sugar epimerase [Idiomarina fontislapidosi]RUO48627.1 nucleoside-diphosphate sugar epimerase [Idiomarina fontislapidosi]